MLNYIWSAILLIGLFVGFLTGNINEVNKAILDSCKSAVNICITLTGVLCLWTGIVEIANKSGLIKLVASLIRPLTKLLFPGVPKEHPAMTSIIMNISANFLGLGNAATPLGIKAMNDLQTLNKKKETATDDMCMFLVINSASLQLIPATIIALRQAAGSLNPSAVIVPIWITSSICFISGIILVKVFAYVSKVKKMNIRLDSKNERT